MQHVLQILEQGTHLTYASEGATGQGDHETQEYLMPLALLA